MAVVILLGWLLIISGIAQGISLLGARHVPHFWLQLVSVILALLIGFLFLRDPAQGLLTVTLLLIVFIIEAFRNRLFLGYPAVSQLGLAAGERTGRNSAFSHTLGKPSGDCTLARRAAARNTVDQRRRSAADTTRLAGAEEPVAPHRIPNSDPGVAPFLFAPRVCVSFSFVPLKRNRDRAEDVQ